MDLLLSKLIEKGLNATEQEILKLISELELTPDKLTEDDVDLIVGMLDASPVSGSGLAKKTDASLDNFDESNTLEEAAIILEIAQLESEKYADWLANRIFSIRQNATAQAIEKARVLNAKNGGDDFRSQITNKFSPAIKSLFSNNAGG